MTRHLTHAHGASAIEADEIVSRLERAATDMPLPQAVVFAFTGLHVSWWDARSLLAGMRREVAVRAVNRRPKRQRQRVKPPAQFAQCLACLKLVPQADMVRKADGHPGSICRKCRSGYDMWTPREPEGIGIKRGVLRTEC